MNLNIEKYLDAFIYSNSYITKDERIIFLKTVEKSKFLFMGDIKNDLSESIQICDIDFAIQSFWQLKFDEKNNILYFVSDTNNLEDFNIFTLHVGTNLVEKITDNKYTQMYDISPDLKYLFYSNQLEHTDSGYESKVYCLNLLTGDRKELYETITDYKITWSDIKISKDKKSIIFNVDFQSKRTKANLMLLNLETLETKILLNKNDECSMINGPLENDFEENFTIISNFEGVENFYNYNLETGEYKKLTNYKKPLKSMTRIECSDNNRKYVTLKNDLKSDKTIGEVISVSENKVEVLNKREFRGNYDLKENDFGIILIKNNLDSPSSMIHFNKNLEETGLVINFLKGDVSELSQCTYEYHEYTTFDSNKVPSFLTLPKGKVKGAIIISFYGGDNMYSTMSNMCAEIGIAVLSPAVRGSHGHGKEWRDHIIGDLGGDEILDVIWAGKFLKKHLGIKEEQIAIAGGSHGGFATLRVLTMPNPYNGIDTSFNFGAGVCSAGFADLVDFYKTSNIPDWLVQMLGEFDEDKYMSRSPINYFDNLNTPLFVAHGTNDKRVSASSMEGFIDKLKDSNKDYELLISEGQGHHTNDKELLLKELTDKFKFYERTILSNS
jgi:dipeptidyl aminopeptidase/acylaminoacyl peptidase